MVYPTTLFLESDTQSNCLRSVRCIFIAMLAYPLCTPAVLSSFAHFIVQQIKPAMISRSRPQPPLCSPPLTATTFPMPGPMETPAPTPRPSKRENIEASDAGLICAVSFILDL